MNGLMEMRNLFDFFWLNTKNGISIEVMEM